MPFIATTWHLHVHSDDAADLQALRGGVSSGGGLGGAFELKVFSGAVDALCRLNSTEKP